MQIALGIGVRRVATIVVMQLVLASAAVAQSASDSASELAARGREAYQLKQYAESARLLVAAAEKDSDEPGLYYNAACSFALAGNKDEAFKHLQSAIDLGFLNAEQIRKDTDFESLRGDARWQALLARLDAAVQRNDRRWNTPALNTPYRENISEDEKVAGLSKLWAEVRYNFANFELVPDLDWDRLYFDYLPRVRASKSTLEYYRLLNELMAKLKDGHSNVFYPRELYSATSELAPLRTRLIEGKVLVTEVYQDELTSAGVVPGVEVISINGLSVRQYAEQNVMPYQSASTLQDLETRTYEYSLLRGPLSETLRMQFRTADGTSFERVIARVAGKQMKVPQRPRFIFQMLPGNVAYVKLNDFGDPKTADDFEQAFEKIASADALILDVRDNGGGSTGVGYRILATLSSKPVSGSTWSTRNYRPAMRAWGQPEGTYRGSAYVVQPNGKLLYTKPVAVLAGPRTFSAAEDFVVAFDVMKRGPIVGEPTGGSTGQPLFFQLPGGGSARVCAKHDSYIDGREFVGHGVQPTRLVKPTVADFRAGRDTVLNVALEEIRIKAGARSE